MSFGETLKSWMDKKEINAYELSELADVPVQTLYSMIKRNSKKADVQYIIRIAKALGVSVDELLGSDKDANTLDLPDRFETAQEAMTFLLRQPAIMGYSGIDIRDMDDDTVLEFANDLLGQMKLVSYKYKKE